MQSSNKLVLKNQTYKIPLKKFVKTIKPTLEIFIFRFNKFLIDKFLG
jgi:hypothetical protein